MYFDPHADTQTFKAGPDAHSVFFYLLNTATYLELVLVLGWFSINFLLGSKTLIFIDSLSLPE